MSGEELELGPVDIVVIGFPPGAPQTGEAIPVFAAAKAKILNA